MRKIFILLLAFLCVACTAKYTAGVDAVVEEDTERYVYYATDNDGKPITGKVTGYYDSGKLKYEALFKDGKQDGIEKSYYESGALEYEAPFKDGIREGVDKKYYESGKLKYKAPYKNEKLEGIAKGYYENGKREYEAPFKDGKADGIVKIYYKSGELEEVLYKGGEEIGRVKLYDNGSQLNYEATYYDNGKIMQEIFYHYYDNGKITIVKEWYSNGETKRRTPYKDGKIEGVEETYYENGKLWRETPYKDGKKEGIEILYKADGIRPKVEHSYKNGILDSTKEYYDESRALFRETSYKDEKKEGIEKWYFENKELWFSLIYKGDKLVSGVCGDGREFSSVDVANVEPKDLCRAQKYTRSEIHIEGSMEYATVASSGLPLTGIVIGPESETPFKNGKLDGIKKDYDYRTLRIETPYKDGIKEGIEKYYYQNGKLLWQGTYKNGNLEGVRQYYDGNGKPQYSVTYEDGAVVNGTCEDGKEVASEDVENWSRLRGDDDWPKIFCSAETALVAEYIEDKNANHTYVEKRGGILYAITAAGIGITGTVVNKNESGRLLVTPFKAGKADGIQKEQWSDGRLNETPYKNGKIDGIVRSYDESGKLEYEAPYKNGKIDGIARHYHKNGKLYSVTPYKDGIKEGIDKHYHQNGKLYSVIPYKDGGIYGIAKWYYANGKLEYEGLFENSNQQGIGKSYHENGKLWFSVTNATGRGTEGICANGIEFGVEVSLLNWDSLNGYLWDAVDRYCGDQ